MLCLNSSEMVIPDFQLGPGRVILTSTEARNIAKQDVETAKILTKKALLERRVNDEYSLSKRYTYDLDNNMTSIGSLKKDENFKNYSFLIQRTKTDKLLDYARSFYETKDGLSDKLAEIKIFPREYLVTVKADFIDKSNIGSDSALFESIKTMFASQNFKLTYKNN